MDRGDAIRDARLGVTTLTGSANQASFTILMLIFLGS